ncbi:MAG: hypothetical protein ABSE68_00225 [Minisyncoccia bacterium]
MKTLPGKETIKDLASLKRQIEEGKVVPPVKIILERGGDKIVIPFENLADINVFQDNNKPESDFAEIKFIVKATELWNIKVGKDGKGKPIFLKNLE